jgi:hypothetical protein
VVDEGMSVLMIFCVGKVKGVEFELNLLEDSEIVVAREMVRDLNLPKELTDFTTQMIRNEGDFSLPFFGISIIQRKNPNISLFLTSPQWLEL